MAVNQKAIYATEHISGEGSRIPYKPGDRLDEKLAHRPEVLKNLQDRGIATDSAAERDRAQATEAERREHVNEQIAQRSEKSESSRKAAGGN